MTSTDPAKAKRRRRLALLAQEDAERIEEPGPGFIGFIEPAPPYDPGPRKKLPSWAKHLRDLRPLKLVE